LDSGLDSLCLSHLAFMKWADDIVLAALLQVPSDKVSENLGNSFASMLDTLNHVYLAELVWFERVQGKNTRLADLPSPNDPAALAQAWPALHKMWLDWAQALSLAEWTAPFTFRNNAGGESTLPYWQIVMHLVNHGSYHRGQFTTLLRQSGLTPQGTDLITYYRTLPG
jgi:uncharacterized damage-inducible protein DinB